jgi:hypothetical protein
MQRSTKDWIHLISNPVSWNRDLSLKLSTQTNNPQGNQ